MKILFAILALLICSITASATQITVASYAVQNWRYGGTTAKLRVYSDTSFNTNDGRTVIAGTPNSPGGFYYEANITILSGTATIAAITLDSTTNGQNTTSARYSAYFFTSDGRRLAPFAPFSGFFISATPGTSQTWTSISLYNYNMGAPPQLRYTYDDDTIERKLQEINAFTNPLTTIGDTIFATTGGALTRLPIGTAAQYMKVSGGLPSWGNLTNGEVLTAIGYTPLNRAGDTMTGALVLSGAPTIALHAATKAYVDGIAGNIAQINGSTKSLQTFTVDSSFPDLEIVDTDDVTTGDHKFGLSAPIRVTSGGTGLATIASGAVLYASSANTLAALSIAGSSGKFLRSNGSAPSWQLVNLATDTTGTVTAPQGGTGSAFFQVSGPATTVKTFTFPNSNATVLTSAALVTSAQGGTGFGTGSNYAAGDILYATGTTTLGKLALGAATTVLHGGGSGAPSYSAVNLANDTTGVLTIAKGGTGLSSLTAGYLTTDGSTISTQALPIPVAAGGTAATGSGYTTNGLFYYTGSAFATTALGASGTVLIGNGIAPVYSASPTLTGLTLSGLTANSIPYIGTSGVISQNNSRLFWEDSATFRFSVQGDIRLINSTVDLSLRAAGSGSDVIYVLPATGGTSGQLLSTGGPSGGIATLSWATVAVPKILSLNGLEDGPQFFTVVNSGSTIQITQPTSATNQLAIPDMAATSVTRGAINNTTQTLPGAKTFSDFLTVRGSASGVASIVFTCSSCTEAGTLVPNGLQYDGTDLFMTQTVPSTAQKTIAYRDSPVLDAQLTANVQLKSEKDTNSGYAGLNSSGVVPLTRGGTGISLTLGAMGTFLRSDGVTGIAFSTDGSQLTALNATSLATGTVDSDLLETGVQLVSPSGAQISAGFSAGKNQASGYAGLSAGSKITASQMTEQLASGDLSDFTGTKSGSGTTALGATITSVATNQILKWDGSAWVNSDPSAATGHDLLSMTHGDTLPAVVTQGAIIIGNGTPKWSALTIGSSGTVLRSTGTTAAWAAVNVGTDVTGTLSVGNGGTGSATATAAFNTLDPLNTNGDILAHNGTDSVRVGVGTAKNVLVADPSGPAPRVKWGQVDLASSDAVTGVLQPANGGMGTMDTNDAFHMLPVEFDGATASVGTLPTATQIRVLRFYLDKRLTVNKVITSIATVGSGKCAIGIYSADGNTKLVDTGALTVVAQGPLSTTLGAPVTLNPGFYYYAWVTTGGTQPAFNYVSAGSAAFQILLNNQAVQYGTAANAAAGSVFPSSLGMITKFVETSATAAVVIAAPMCKLQN